MGNNLRDHFTNPQQLEVGDVVCLLGAFGKGDYCTISRIWLTEGRLRGTPNVALDLTHNGKFVCTIAADSTFIKKI